MFPIPMVTIWDGYRVARKRAGASADPDFFNTKGLRLSKKGFYHHGDRYFSAAIACHWAVFKLAIILWCRSAQHSSVIRNPPAGYLSW